MEDDLLFSPDFLEYFEYNAPILEQDPTTLVLSAWNDNGYKGLVSVRRRGNPLGLPSFAFFGFEVELARRKCAAFSRKGKGASCRYIYVVSVHSQVLTNKTCAASHHGGFRFFESTSDNNSFQLHTSRVRILT